MKTNTKMCLFGGALMTAGLTAQAQTFIYADADTTATYGSFASSYAYGVGGTADNAYRPATLDTYASGYSYALGTTTMSTSQTATSMRTEGSWDGGGYVGYGYGTNIMQQWFQTSADGALRIDWDVSGTDGYASALVLEDVSGNTLSRISPFALGTATSGTRYISVDAGVDYGILFGLQDIFITGAGPFIFNSTDAQFINVTLIPAPGAAALLGLGGLVATRRRRS